MIELTAKELFLLALNKMGLSFRSTEDNVIIINEKSCTNVFDYVDTEERVNCNFFFGPDGGFDKLELDESPSDD